jgi:hypothetical protein
MVVGRDEFAAAICHSNGTRYDRYLTYQYPYNSVSVANAWQPGTAIECLFNYYIPVRNEYHTLGTSGMDNPYTGTKDACVSCYGGGWTGGTWSRVDEIACSVAYSS